jgi:hypothetical protein
MAVSKDAPIIPTNKQIAKALLIRASDTCAAGGWTSIPRALGKTWAYEFKKSNRPKPKAKK